MANKRYFVDVDIQANDVINLKADTLDITSNLASANTKRIVYWSGQYYYSDGTSWIALGNTGTLPTGGATGDILAKASGTDYDVEWISNYTSTVQHEVKAGVAITKGQAVYVSSADGTNMIVSKASNASEATSSKTMGLAASTAALNGIIFVITEGLITGTGGAPLDTSSATAGDPVWLGTNGNLLFGLANKPVAPAHLVFIGIVTRSSATVGEIFVKVQNGFELNELHDVLISSPVTDQIIKRDSDGLWKNWTPNYTTGSGTTNKLSKWTSATVLGDSLISDNGSRTNIGGTYISNTALSIQSGISNLYGVNIFASANAVSASVITDGATCISGYSVVGVGVYGESSGSPSFGPYGINIGVQGKAFESDLPALTTCIGGKFEAFGGGWNYSVQLIDGTETVAGRFLKNIDIYGHANWATLTVADTGLTLTTTGTSGAATLVGNTLNIPQYTGNSGTVTSVSVVSANGLAGTVANATTTPAITLSTSVTGLLKGNGTAISAASAGTDYQAPVTLTTTGTNGAATFDGTTLNIPNYESSLVPKLNGTEIWRGSTYRNNSTTVDTTSGYTVTVAGTAVARAIGATNFATRSIRMGITASVVATGRYSGLNGPGQQFILSAGFMFVGEFYISDTAFATGTHNFWGLAGYVGNLNIGDVGNAQPSALLNTIAFANDSGDANLQFMYNDGAGVATKIDLGASFPSNRTAGAAITTIYSCYIYNPSNSSTIIYKIVNKETGAIAQGTVSSNLPATNVGLNYYGVRTMGTSGGGVTNSGQFDVYRLGIYSL